MLARPIPGGESLATLAAHCAPVPPCNQTEQRSASSMICINSGACPYDGGLQSPDCLSRIFRKLDLPDSLRRQVLLPLLESDADTKAALTRSLCAGAVYPDETIAEPAGIPGRPGRPELIAHFQLRQRSVHTLEGRAALVHSLTHIELNAIDLALDVIWRFEGLPADFYLQWLNVAKEEALHFQLLRDHLNSMGYSYGSFPAHPALWQMAEKTRHDLLARISLVPRTMEARGLDASPLVKVKLLKAGDVRGGEILDLILRDEIGHVGVGNFWYRWLCKQRGLDEIRAYQDLVEKYQVPKPRGPFNLAGRRAAGFTQQELELLGAD